MEQIMGNIRDVLLFWCGEDVEAHRVEEVP
jgi:hypothetical protein